MSNYVLTLPLKTEKWQEDKLNKDFEECRSVYNTCLGEIYKRYNHMRESKEYRKIVKLIKDKDRNKQFTEINKKYNLTEYSLHKYVKQTGKYFKLDSHASQKIATRCFNAFQKLMFHQANRVYFKKKDEFNSIEGKTNKQGIRFRDGCVLFDKMNIPSIIKNNDIYIQIALRDKIKYCRILRKVVKHKYHYYVQLILDGTPPTKIDRKTGEMKNSIGIGKVGIDIGTQTIAYTSDYGIGLKELAPEINNIEKEKRLLQRKLDRSRRATNPNKYNENGTINIKNRGRWVYSNRYTKIKNKLKEIQRKQADIRKQSHNKLANYLLNLGNEFYVETMNFKGLQRRAKNTTINEKTGKFNKKRRFGKSIANKAPSMFLTILDNKLKWNGTQLYKINTFKVKASQYNHIEDIYVKKKLSERWNDFGRFKIQRDLYSAFIIQHVVGKDLDEINREDMIKDFDAFKRMHDKEIIHIRSNGSKLISSMGI